MLQQHAPQTADGRHPYPGDVVDASLEVVSTTEPSAQTPARVRIVSGGGRYTDPWHPFAETSAAIASAATELGLTAEVVDPEPEALSDLTDVDLMVINSGGNPEVELTPDPTWSAAFDAFGEWITAGHPLLGVHTASNAFPDWPQWPALLGGRWVRGRSRHPARTEFTFDALPGSLHHPALGGLTSVTAFDERYSYLEVHPEATGLLQHRFEDIDHVIGWARTDGLSKVVFDGLGHGPESYESAERVHLLSSELRWLLA